MEQWAREWLKEQRDKGVKCLEVKMQGENHYVYHSTSYWDKELKKPRKTSKYLGKLDPDKGLIKSGTRQSQNSTYSISCGFSPSALIPRKIKTKNYK